MIGPRLRASKVSSNEGDPFFDSVVALMHFDGADESTAFIDEIGNSWSGSEGVALDTAQSKFGVSSLILGGAPDLLTGPAILGAGDFTVECFIRTPATIGSTQVFWSQFASGVAGRCGAYLNTSGQLSFFVNGLGGGNLNLTHPTVLAANAWHYACVTRESNVFNTHVNGVSGTGAARTGAIANTAFVIGATESGVQHYTGWFDELRITDGMARDVSIIPVSEFPEF